MKNTNSDKMHELAESLGFEVWSAKGSLRIVRPDGALMATGDVVQNRKTAIAWLEGFQACLGEFTQREKRQPLEAGEAGVE